jgi:hypothetical protein
MSASDPMTLPQLLEKFQDASPHLAEKAFEIISKSTFFNLEPNTDVRAVVKNGGYDFVMAVGIMDFLTWAFGEGDKGYSPEPGTWRE